MSSHKYGEIPENEDPVARQLRKLDLQWYLRSPYLWGLLAVAIASIFTVISPFTKSQMSPWSPGDLHLSHKAFAKNCQVCHQQQFEKVQDSSCLGCHKLSPHGQQQNAVQNVVPVTNHFGDKNCIDCHVEHQGQEAFTVKESKLCVECHGNIKAVSLDSKLNPVPSFENHPEFMLNLAGQNVSLKDRLKLTDTNKLKFNHFAHLKENLKSPKGEVSLKCEDCHKFTHDTPDRNDISFEKNCRSCHELSFDDRLPKSQVPHGNSDLVYLYLIGEYSKLLGGKEVPAEIIAPSRKIPGREIREQSDQVVRASATDEARASEAVLFTKTSCQLCHMIEQKETTDQFSSKYRVIKPELKKHWLDKAQFSHSSHQLVKCESCHPDAAKSKVSSDVMIPGVENCKTCHVDQGHKGVIVSDCADCHKYHQSQFIPQTQAKELESLVQSLK